MHLTIDIYEYQFVAVTIHITWASLVAQMVKNLTAMQETWVQSLCWEDPLGKDWQFTPLFLPRETDGQRCLEGYSLWDH